MQLSVNFSTSRCTGEANVLLKTIKKILYCKFSAISLIACVNLWVFQLQVNAKILDSVMSSFVIGNITKGLQYNCSFLRYCIEKAQEIKLRMQNFSLNVFSFRNCHFQTTSIRFSHFQLNFDILLAPLLLGFFHDTNDKILYLLLGNMIVLISKSIGNGSTMF